MPPKPHRVLLDRVSGYADEAAAYMRRRRVARRPFARLYYANGRSADHAGDSDSRRRAVRRRRAPDRGRRQAGESSERADRSRRRRARPRPRPRQRRPLRRGLRRTPPRPHDVDRRVADRVGPVRRRGGRRGAGDRGRHDLLRPRRRARPGRPRARRRRSRLGAARRAPRAAAAAGAVAGTPLPIEHRPEDVAGRPQGRAAARARRARPRPGRRDRPVHRLLRRGPARGRDRQLRRPAQRRRPHPDPDRRPGGRPPRRQRSRPAPRRSAPTAASSCSKTTRRRSPSRRRARR